MEFSNDTGFLKTTTLRSDLPSNSFVVPFYLTGSPANKTPKIRGRICRLVKPVTDILGRHNYPDSVNSILAEAMVVTSCLSTTFKLDGVITLQAKGQGPLKTLFCDVSSDGHMRAYAALEAQTLKTMPLSQETTLPVLMGDGYMAFTIEPNGPNQRYQGIVDLSGKTVSDAVISWFKNSEQVHTQFITMTEKRDGFWVAATLMIQKVADEGGSEDGLLSDERAFWQEANIFAQSVASEELLDPKLELETLLFRLFHELGVYIQPPRVIIDKCRCSNDKVETMLRSINKDELPNLVDENGELVVDCEFCKKRHVFSADLKTH